jgi:hypothetical protein
MPGLRPGGNHLVPAMRRPVGAHRRCSLLGLWPPAGCTRAVRGVPPAAASVPGSLLRSLRWPASPGHRVLSTGRIADWPDRWADGCSRSTIEPAGRQTYRPVPLGADGRSARLQPGPLVGRGPQGSAAAPGGGQPAAPGSGKPRRWAHAERAPENVRNAFRAEPGPWSGSGVVLIDDLFTTGATLGPAQLPCCRRGPNRYSPSPLPGLSCQWPERTNSEDTPCPSKW